MIGSMLEAHEKEKIAEIANGYLGYLHERIPRQTVISKNINVTTVHIP